MKSAFNALFGLILAAMLVALPLAFVVRGISSFKEMTARRRWLGIVSSLFILVGMWGVIGSILIYGTDWLPPSFEWPAGYVQGVLTTLRGNRIILVKGVARVQVYDARWHFVRGWHVDRAQKLHLLPDETVEVLQRGGCKSVIDVNGKLLSQGMLSPKDIDLHNLPLGEDARVPTSPFLYMFSSPAMSLLVVVFRGVGLSIADIRASQRFVQKEADPP